MEYVFLYGYGVLWVLFQRFFWCVFYSWLDFFAYFSYCVELKGCVWVLTEQEEVGEFENNWVGKGGEL